MHRLCSNRTEGVAPAAARRRQSGFTLVELMVSISIIGVLMAIGIPHLRAHILDSRLESALPHLAQIHASQRIHFNENGRYCCLGGTLSEDTLDGSLGLRIEENGDFCFVFICTDTDLCAATSGSFISAAETGDPIPEFEVWAILRSSTASTVTGPNGTVCTAHASKRPPSGWVEGASSGDSGREGLAVVMRYPAPPNGVDTVVSSRGIAHVWNGGVSVTDAMLP